MTLLDEVLEGLRGDPPRLPPKLFYDERGAALFEAITRLPEYYPTRTEMGILGDCCADVARRVGPGARVVEFGSGSGDKTWILLEHLERPAVYVPVDVSRAQLEAFAAQVRERFPALEVRPVAGDYTRLDALPGATAGHGNTLAFFPGSTVGNLEPDQARTFMATVAELSGPDSFLLIGVDLVKDAATLERAYNDEAGVTRDFNLNMLAHLNRRLEADFDLDAFRHRALWNAEASRIEMHLVSQRDQTVTFRGNGATPAVHLGAGQAVVTEHSYKYTLEDFRDLAAGAGYTVLDVWTDARRYFSVQLLRRS